MLHQTLPLLFLFNPSTPPSSSSCSPPPPPAALPRFSSSKVVNEARMDFVQPAALKTSFRRESFTSAHYHHLPNQHQFLLSEEAWTHERSGLVGDDFSVDDLLDLGGIVEELEPHQVIIEEEEEEHQQQQQQQRLQQQKQHQDEEEESDSSGLSSEAVPATESLLPESGISDLAWVSQLVDDSFSEFPCSTFSPPYHPTPKPDATQPRNPFSGPSSGSKRARVGCFAMDNLVVPAKARSKRCRTGGRVWSLFRPQLAEPISSSHSASPASSSASSSACYSSSALIYEGNPDLPLYCVGGKPPLEMQQKKKKGRKPKATTAEDGGAQGQRRCSHCGVQKTPQWRTGPLGAKTLCNACGVRYKSGRLLPEYRPASSPTFLSHVHSNCHRKVLEMRRKNELTDAAATSSPPPAGVQLQHVIS